MSPKKVATMDRIALQVKKGLDRLYGPEDTADIACNETAGQDEDWQAEAAAEAKAAREDSEPVAQQNFWPWLDKDGNEMAKIQNGIFTIESPTGEHRTFRVRTWKKIDGQKVSDDKAPKRALGLLVNNNNESDYREFAFVNDDQVFVWKRFKGSEYEKLAACFESMMLDPRNSRYAKRGMKIHGACNCQRCDRLLTTPESIKRGIGPECAEKWGK